MSLLSKFERNFQFCNKNYLVCDNNGFFKSIGYNTVCGILNSYATPDTRFEGLGVNTTKIEKLFSFCIFALIFCVESKELKEIFRRYEINHIELTDDALDSINEYWKNLVDAKHIPFTDTNRFGEYLENLIYVTAKINSEGINSDNVYYSILKYWNSIVSFKINGDLLAFLLSNLKPTKEVLIAILDKLTSNLDNYDNFDDCYEWIAHYLSEMGLTYDIDMSKLKNGKYSKELCHLYKVINPSLQGDFSSFCQNNIYDVRNYLKFIVDNNLEVLSLEDFGDKLKKIGNNPNYYKIDCYWMLSKMRNSDKYSCVHETIDEITKDNECMKFFLAPIEYDKKENIDVEWILTTGGEGVPELAKIPEYKAKLKKYLVDNKYLSVKTRNNIVNVL